MPPTSLLAALRDATAEQHARTESVVPVLDPALTLAGYAAILRRFRAVYGALEEVLARVEQWPEGFDWTARRKVPLLDRDLAWLASRGVIADETIDVAGATAAFPDVPALPEAIGMLYVLEGATLGGQLIARRVGPRLGITPDAGASFFAGMGEATGRRWRAFGAMADRWGASHPEAWDRVAWSARATFHAIAAPFVESPVVP